MSGCARRTRQDDFLEVQSAGIHPKTRYTCARALAWIRCRSAVPGGFAALRCSKYVQFLAYPEYGMSAAYQKRR